MTNQYVPDLTPLGSGDLARSADVNDRYENTVSGFDRLPTPKVGEQGFSAAVPVGTPVNADHATTKNWVETAMTSQVNIAEGHADDAEAAKLAAQTSEANALSSANTASTQAGVATTKAGEAATSASNAATSATNAATSESNAATSESNAATSASNASTSASSASSSATAAQTAETNAVAAYDSFDDRYLGPKSADPSTDNDGNTLLTGALYFDTNNGTMKVWDGTSWDPAYVPPDLLTLDEVTTNGNTTTNAVTVGQFTSTNPSVNFTNLGNTTSTTDPVLMITAAGLVQERLLGSNAFNSNTYDNYQGWQLNGGSSTEAIGKNETVTFTGAGGATVTNSGNTVTINSTDTNTTDFNVSASGGTAENISAGETVDFAGTGGISVSRTGNNFTIDGSAAGTTELSTDTTPQLGGTLDANGNTIDMGVNVITDTAVGNWNTAYNDKITTVVFDTNNGNLTLNQVDGGTVVVNLDGRYGAITGSLTTSTTFGGDVSGTYNTISVTDDSHGHSFANLLNKGLGTGTYTTTGAYSAPELITAEVRTNNGTQLVLSGGDSSTQATGQTGEKVYLNAENGIEIVSSPDNWASGWAGRKTATINDSSGNSSLPGNLGLTGNLTAAAITGTGDLVVDTDTLFVDASTDRVGVGTTSPGVDLDIHSAGDTVLRVYTSGTGVSDDTIIRTQIAGTTASNYIYFGDADDINTGQIRYVHSDDSMRFYAGATTEKIRISSTNIGFRDAAGEIARFDSARNLTVNGIGIFGGTSVSGGEGGELRLTMPPTTNLSGTHVTLDAQTNSVRFFESGGTTRGATLDLTGCAASAGSTIWHSGNDGASSGLDADLLDGLQSATTATASTIVARDANGDTNIRYCYTSYLNMSHTTGTRNSDTIFYSSDDNFLRKNNATGMRSSLNVPTRTGGDASGTWGISITGNAATATSATSATTATSATSATTASRLVSTTTTTATNKTLADGEFCTVTASGRTITLPASPTAGDRVYISVGNFTDTTVGRNSQNIMGLAENMTIDKAYVGLEFVYSGNATQGWRII